MAERSHDIRMINEQLNLEGYQVIEGVFSKAEVEHIKQTIATHASLRINANGIANIHAIRDFFSEVPDARAMILTKRLTEIVFKYAGPGFFVVKSIYFDKPPESNWFVSWHQDLTISVKEKIAQEGFSKWTIKENCFSVQPSQDILKNMLTIRIHLDDTDENNGALKVLPESHINGPQRFSPEMTHSEKICRVKSGGVMLMRPLLFHSSNRTTNGMRRRVIHIEFGNAKLPAGLSWAEMKSGRTDYNPLAV